MEVLEDQEVLWDHVDQKVKGGPVPQENHHQNEKEVLDDHHLEDKGFKRNCGTWSVVCGGPALPPGGSPLGGPLRSTIIRLSSSRMTTNTRVFLFLMSIITWEISIRDTITTRWSPPRIMGNIYL